MSDNELLELAAKAAGAGHNEGAQEYTIPKVDGAMLVETKWNPLDDDGDALRLATKLNINIEFDDDEQATNIRNEFGGLVLRTMWFDDKYEATRRSIVRAAAEIGSQS